MYKHSALNEYQNINVESRVPSSSPHNLVAMLLDGLLERLARAMGAIERGGISEKGAALSSGIQIVDSLRASLDYSQGGEIAANLGSLYDYIERRLLEANVNSDTQIIAEVVSLVKQIKAGWDAVPDELRGV